MRKITLFLFFSVCLLLTGCNQKQTAYVYKETCEICHESVEQWIPTVYESKVCADCFYQNGWEICRGCGLAYDPSDFDCVDGYCTGCAEENTWGCSICESWLGLDHLVDIGDGYYLCPDCASGLILGKCDEIKKNSQFVSRLEQFPQS